jgi:hypothetical protein
MSRFAAWVAAKAKALRPPASAAADEVLPGFAALAETIHWGLWFIILVALALAGVRAMAGDQTTRAATAELEQLGRARDRELVLLVTARRKSALEAAAARSAESSAHAIADTNTQLRRRLVLAGDHATLNGKVVAIPLEVIGQIRQERAGADRAHDADSLAIAHWHNAHAADSIALGAADSVHTLDLLALHVEHQLFARTIPRFDPRALAAWDVIRQEPVVGVAARYRLFSRVEAFAAATQHIAIHGRGELLAGVQIGLPR